jgi:hypothetical protein
MGDPLDEARSLAAHRIVAAIVTLQKAQGKAPAPERRTKIEAEEKLKSIVIHTKDSFR